VTESPVIIGPCTLYCGDCLDILPQLSGVDAVVTDPPYGAERASAGIREKTWRKATEYVGDWVDSPDYIEKVAVRAIELCNDIAPAVALTPGFKCLNLYPRPSHIGGYFYQGQSTVTAWGAAWWQPILFYGKDPKTGMLQRDMFIGKSNPESQRNGHPCPKELDSWRLLVERMSFAGETILDPFMGSGTTGVACIRTERRFIGIEKEPKYFDIACKRIEREWQLKKSELPFEKPAKEVQRELVTA
jgi:DNA modification methylase